MQHIINGVTARYPRLNTTYKFDSVEQRSVKCDPLDDGAAYETQFVMESDTAKTLHGLCMEAWKNAAAMDTKKKWPEKPSLLPYKKTDEGQIIGKAKLKGAYGTDKVEPPLQVDAKRNQAAGRLHADDGQPREPVGDDRALQHGRGERRQPAPARGAGD
jgi:hypothetical protein